MLEMKEPPAAPKPSRRLPPRKRSASTRDADPESLGERMDRLEAVLRQALRANKEVLRTLDPERGEAARQRRELAAFGERVKDGLAGVARVVRGELRAAAERQNDLWREVDRLRETVEALSRRPEDPGGGGEPAPVTRLGDVRLRLARLPERLEATGVAEPRPG